MTGKFPNRQPASDHPVTYTASMTGLHLRVAFEAMTPEGFSAHRISELRDEVCQVRFSVERRPKELVHKQLVRWAFSDVALLANPTNWI